MAVRRGQFPESSQRAHRKKTRYYPRKSSNITYTIYDIKRLRRYILYWGNKEATSPSYSAQQSRPIQYNYIFNIGSIKYFDSVRRGFPIWVFLYKIPLRIKIDRSNGELLNPYANCTQMIPRSAYRIYVIARVVSDHRRNGDHANVGRKLVLSRKCIII